MGAGDVRTMVHATWAAVAPNWAEYADALDAHEAVLTQRMLDGVAISPGERVLELACGPGGVGLAAATLAGPDGEVVVSDVAAEMAAVAAARAQARGLHNVRAATLDHEDIDEPDASYDVVFCRQGLMFAVAPSIAVREIARVLRPGGRAAVTVWGPPSANPWLSLVFGAASAAFGHPVPPPGIPGPFSLTDADWLRSTLVEAGLVDVHVTDVEDVRRSRLFDECWKWTTALAGPLSMLLAQAHDTTRTAIVERVRDAAEPYSTAAGVELPSLARLAIGRRPGGAGSGG